MGRHSKSESDIEDGFYFRDSRTGHGVDGSHARRTASEEDFDAYPTGAEARNQQS
jgi:hypothetical protein